jgi:hypothetical protein
MFIPAFWVGFVSCLVVEIVIIVATAFVSCVEKNTGGKTDSKEDKS